jgi:diaminopimelate decarboxylase
MLNHVKELEALNLPKGKMEFRLAKNNDIKELTSFFEKNLKYDDFISREFFCPIGLKVAIKDDNVIICTQDTLIIGGLRFYLRKKDNIVSLYQFAIDKNYRGKDILRQTLKKTGHHNFESSCHRESSLNIYYEKTGWVLKKQNDISKCWTIII